MWSFTLLLVLQELWTYQGFFLVASKLYNPLWTAKMTKMHHENPKYPKTTTIPTTSFKMTKIPLNPQNKKSTLETIENDLNIPKQSQITLSFLDFAGILVGLKFFCSFWSILWHFSHFCNVEVYILIILDVWDTLTVYEILTFRCSL